MYLELLLASAVLDSIVVSISACHAEDLGSIPGRGVIFFIIFFVLGKLQILFTGYFSVGSGIYMHLLQTPLKQPKVC